MKRLVILFSMILALQVTATNKSPEKDYAMLNTEFIDLENETFDIESELFEELFTVILNIEDIEITEIEEVVIIDFDTKKYLPLRFNAQKGMHDIDWASVELVEVEDDVIINFDTKSYLPYGFCPNKIESEMIHSL